MGRVVEAELKLKYKEAVKNLDEFQKEFAKVEKDLDTANEKLKKSEKSTSSFSKGIRGIGTAFKAAGIGAVVALFGALAAALSKNQKVMDGVALVTGTISQVFTEVGNVLVAVYERVSSTSENFDAMARVVSNLFKVAIAPFKLIMDGMVLTFYEVQLAYEKSWLGKGRTSEINKLNRKIRETKQSLRDTKDGLIEAGSAIVNDFGEAISEIGDIGSQVVDGLSNISLKAISENVKANEQLKKAAAEARIVNQGLIEQYDRQAEQQRQIRDNDLKSIDDRIKANNELKVTLEEQEKSMLANANLMIEQAELQFKLSGLEEDRLALLEARNEKKAIEAQIEGFMSEQESNRVALQKERLELELSAAEGRAERQQAEREFNAEMELNEVTRIEKMLENLEIEKKVEEERLKAKVKTFEEGTQAQQDAQHELDLFLQDSANNQEKLERDLGLAKENQLKQTLGNIAGIVGQNSKFGKAIAIVQALQDTYAGANKALAQGGLFGFIGAAAVIAAGIANVKQIAGSKTPKPPASLGARSTGGESTPSIPAASSPSVPPDFSTVGASGVNQLADVLGNQPPPRAFVVSGDVTTAQQLDRNIVSSASLG
jgi:hypothetical protein